MNSCMVFEAGMKKQGINPTHTAWQAPRLKYKVPLIIKSMDIVLLAQALGGGNLGVPIL